MRLNRNSIIRIAKNKILEANTKLDSLNYQKWQLFVENYNDYFIWNENTDEGKKTLENINEFSDRIRNKLLTTLNKGIIFPSARMSNEANVVIFKYFQGNTPPSISVTDLIETID